MSTEVPSCHDCNLSTADPGWVETIVPDVVWNQIRPGHGHGGGMLCFSCIARRCRIRGLVDVPYWFVGGVFRKTYMEDVAAGEVSPEAFGLSAGGLTGLSDKSRARLELKMAVIDALRIMLGPNYSRNGAESHPTFGVFCDEVGSRYAVSGKSVQRWWMVARDAPTSMVMEKLLSKKRPKKGPLQLYVQEEVRLAIRLNPKASASELLAAIEVNVKKSGYALPSLRSIQRFVKEEASHAR